MKKSTHIGIAALFTTVLVFLSAMFFCVATPYLIAIDAGMIVWAAIENERGK